jgi:RND family efflux transporter MFP subunit
LAVRVLFVAAALITAAACKQPEAQAKAKESGPAAVQVKTIAVGHQPMPRFLTVTGTLRADRDTEVAADAVGKVIQTYVERGQPVRVGEPLARLDVRFASLTEAQARAQTRLAQQNAELAKLECERGEQLFKASSISRSEYDRRKSQCETALSSVEIAERGHALAEKNLRDAVVRAPFTGIVGERFVSVGQYVRADSRVASIYAIDPLRLEMTVPEANVAAVQEDGPVEFRVAAYNQTFDGRVKYISPVVRQRSRDLVVEALVKNPDGLLKPGMFAEARLSVGEHDVPVLPQSAIRKGEVAASVFSINQGRISERIVQLGEAREGLVALLSGVKPGEKVIDAPTEKIQDGVPVTE